MAVESLADAARVVVDELAGRRVKYLVTGMFSGLYWLGSEAEELTFDVDFSIYAPRQDADSIRESLARKYGWPVERDTPDLVTLRVRGMAWKVDLMKAVIPEESGSSPEHAALAKFFASAYRRSEVRSISRREMRLARPEDIIVTKTLLRRPKDVGDVQVLSRIEWVDRKYMLARLRELGLEGWFQEMLLQEPAGRRAGLAGGIFPPGGRGRRGYRLE